MKLFKGQSNITSRDEHKITNAKNLLDGLNRLIRQKNINKLEDISSEWKFSKLRRKCLKTTNGNSLFV